MEQKSQGSDNQYLSTGKGTSASLMLCTTEYMFKVKEVVTATQS